MKKEKEIVARISYIDYKCTSYYGNPSYYVRFVDEKDNWFWGYTGSNCSIGYSISSFNPALYYRFKYHITKNGNIVLTYMTIEKHADVVDSRDI